MRMKPSTKTDFFRFKYKTALMTRVKVNGFDLDVVLGQPKTILVDKREAEEIKQLQGKKVWCELCARDCTWKGHHIVQVSAYQPWETSLQVELIPVRSL